MHTTTETTNPELLAVRQQLKLHRLHLKLTMLRVQIKALETLERLMDDPEPTGDEQKDRFEATKRNRRRLAANQTLIHCRTADREKRLANTSRARKEAASTPSPLAGEGGRDSGRMRGRSESSGVTDHPQTPTAPPKKFIKPKHPRRSRKRKRG